MYFGSDSHQTSSFKFSSVNNFLLQFRSQKIVKMSSRKTAGRRGTTKKRAQRATSNVFAMFNQDQIQEFKEAFNMIDQNRDGFIDKEDLHDVRIYLKDIFIATSEYRAYEQMPGPSLGSNRFWICLNCFGSVQIVLDSFKNLVRINLPGFFSMLLTSEVFGTKFKQIEDPNSNQYIFILF